jgi:hypothetical protein
MSKREPSQDWRNVRQAVFARDRDRCLNCRASKEAIMLDVDHGVPRGAGGADRISNQNSYCRRCHDAKHEKCIAPSVQLQSTGQMTDREFGWFKHFVDEMIPAMSQAAGGRVIPKFNLDDENIWYLPIGDVIHLDEQLADDGSIEYMSASLEDYM